jgi:hypothetical protein
MCGSGHENVGCGKGVDHGGDKASVQGRHAGANRQAGSAWPGEKRDLVSLCAHRIGIRQRSPSMDRFPVSCSLRVSPSSPLLSAAAASASQ